LSKRDDPAKKGAGRVVEPPRTDRSDLLLVLEQLEGIDDAERRFATGVVLLPEGAEFARAHRDDLERIAIPYLERDTAQGEGSTEDRRLREAYRALGVF